MWTDSRGYQMYVDMVDGDLMSGAQGFAVVQPLVVGAEPPQISLLY